MVSRFSNHSPGVSVCTGERTTFLSTRGAAAVGIVSHLWCCQAYVFSLRQAVTDGRDKVDTLPILRCGVCLSVLTNPHAGGVIDVGALGHMRYFTYIAEQSFKSSPTGERLFYSGGPWSRPFIIPDADTEQRLYRKYVWMLRVFLGGLIIGQPFLFALRREVLNQPYWFVVYLVILMAVFWVVGRIVFARDLRGLQRAPRRLRLRSFYGQAAQRHTRAGLFLGFIGSLLFVASGIWMLSVGANLTIAVICVVFFGLCAVVWGYALYLKSQTGGSPNESDEKRRG